MILVRNRQQLLSGNKLLAVLTFIAVLASCSPKITKPVVKTPAKPVEQKTAAKFTQGNISVFVPFQLNKFNLKTVTKAQIGKADMALDFYQGLMLGIDSAANTGLNFKVNVFDTRDDNSQLATLIKKEAVKSSNLIIGPVFPDGVKYMTGFSEVNKLPLISPLAASKPSEFNNPYLISIVNDIETHGKRVADYIAKENKAEQTIVVLINTKKSSDEAFARPVKSQFASKYPSFVVQEFTSTYVFETKMVKGKKYAVVVCSDDAPFVAPSLTKLHRLKNVAGYPIQVFGHPNWAKQTYNIDQLQSLETVLSSSYHIDYKSKNAVDFVKVYRDKYEFEPTEYAFKGFDIGFYFGKLMAKYGISYTDYLIKEKYKGLTNDFDFGYDAEYGYYNKHLKILQYKDTALVQVD
ncbi:ABC transporter substrate-binding protein [Pedobacter sp. SL55]|uniref:ABC transporter substrate-binding protein n=1 Tax=Pedobacter sp. SL55 TaxID=2995161 RepID=UPI00226E4F77|nr:ABC transporter substrate-binding protein [Pedobacter sp. SL55]WAC40360.1 ABC transporter substrate-binding protein [Pedobacter sp. SL55]